MYLEFGVSHVGTYVAKQMSDRRGEKKATLEEVRDINILAIIYQLSSIYHLSSQSHPTAFISNNQ